MISINFDLIYTGGLHEREGIQIRQKFILNQIVKVTMHFFTSVFRTS